MSRDVFCAMCEHFSANGHPEQAAQGMGYCKGFDGSIEPFEQFRRWDDACVLFGPAPDMQARMNWIARKRREESGGDAAAA